MFYLRSTFEFESSHRLPNHQGLCNKLHGHSYKLEVCVESKDLQSGENNPESGMVMDFSNLKKIVKVNVIDVFDHAHLNDFYINPTAEVMAEDIYWRIRKLIPSLHSVKLWETSRNCVEYIGGK